jgi:hypothetical protein
LIAHIAEMEEMKNAEKNCGRILWALEDFGVA